MPYVSTDRIIVFPSTRRMNKQVSARLISEQSLASLINKLIEVEGFVITPDNGTAQGFDPTQPFEFNVFGYYFKVNAANDILGQFNISTDSEIYANIYLDKNTETVTNGSNYMELAGVDENITPTSEEATWIYKGVTFSTTNLSQASEDPADHSLLLFKKEVGAGGTSIWVVPVESRLKFVYTFALGVDGGEIVSAI